MDEFIYIEKSIPDQIFNKLTDVPFNLWWWLLLFTAPILIFSAKPESSVYWRILRIMIAIAVGYVLLILAYIRTVHLIIKLTNNVKDKVLLEWIVWRCSKNASTM